MELLVKCGICDVTLVEVCKEVILEQDRDLYISMCSCNDHGVENIEISVPD